LTLLSGSTLPKGGGVLVSLKAFGAWFIAEQPDDVLVDALEPPVIDARRDPDGLMVGKVVQKNFEAESESSDDTAKQLSDMVQSAKDTADMV
jgi:hypothetical protein